MSAVALWRMRTYRVLRRRYAATGLGANELARHGVTVLARQWN